MPARSGPRASAEGCSTGRGECGPSFLGDYSRFLKDLASFGGAEQAERYAMFVGDMGSGEMPEEYRPIVQAYMLEHPIESLGGVIDQGIAAAKAEHREGLVRLKADLQRKNETAALAAKAAVEAPAVEGVQPLGALDSTSLLLLSGRPEPELKAMRIDPAAIRMVMRARAAGGP